MFNMTFNGGHHSADCTEWLKSYLTNVCCYAMLLLLLLYMMPLLNASPWSTHHTNRLAIMVSDAMIEYEH